MNALIVYNAEKSSVNIAQKAADVFLNSNISSVILEFKDFLKNTNEYKNIIESSNVLIVIGGDGTIIKAAKIAAIYNLSIIGINAGHLGYLASLDPENIDNLKRFALGDYTIENRIILKAEKLVDSVTVDSCECLNDAVISKHSSAKIIDIAVTIGNDTISYRADGIIAATPTGSTAYSMSAGGPVVDPTLDCIVVTPVCPHTLLNRSLVINSNTPITFNISSNNDDEVAIFLDGQIAFKLDKFCTVRISVSEHKAKFIKLNNSSVYKIFFDKSNHC